MMIRIHTLGGLSLAGSGRAVDTLLGREKRLALLFYLVIHQPGRAVSRDHLLATFWPEADDDDARNCLRQSLHVLRNVLGDALISHGRSEIGLKPGVVWCDAVAFGMAVTAGSWANALALYRGTFLDGYHVADAYPFMDWCDALRERLRRDAVRSALESARGAAQMGLKTSALRWHRRAAELAPYDDAVHRALLRAHLSTGDRAGALLAFERFRQTLHDDLDLEPSGETAAILAPAGSPPSLARPRAWRPTPKAGSPPTSVESTLQSFLQQTPD
jgi:DNA-binding SARP family transcriptional activator